MEELNLLDIDLGKEDILDLLDVGLDAVVNDWHEHLGERLAHIDTHLLAQGEHHRGRLLGEAHTLFKLAVDEALVALRHRLVVDGVALRHEVEPEPLHIERRNRR